MSDETAITVRPKSISAIVESYNGKPCHLLLPKTSMAAIPAGATVSVREITIDVDNDTYKLPGSSKLALGKRALDQLASAASITWVHVKRIDDRTQPHYYEYEARARIQDLDGSVRDAIGTRVVDLRSDNGSGAGEKDAAGMSQSQLRMARKFAAEACASKAMNRAIANILAIPRSYTKADLAHPFVVAKLVPDGNHPVAQQAMLAAMCGATDALFGGAASQSHAEPPPQLTAPVDTDPPHDPVTGEVSSVLEQPPVEVAPSQEIGAEEATKRLAESWRLAKEIGISVEGWHKLRAACGAPEKAEDMTSAHVLAIEAAVTKAWSDAQ
jgi:hypothetical protein